MITSEKIKRWLWYGANKTIGVLIKKIKKITFAGWIIIALVVIIEIPLLINETYKFYFHYMTTILTYRGSKIAWWNRDRVWD